MRVLRVVAAAAALIAAAVALAPAAWLERPLAARTHERLHLVDASGLWWNGRGTLATADGAARVPLAWRVAFAPLFGGALAVDLDASGDDASPSGSVLARRNGFELRDVRLRAPAALLAALAPALRAFAVGGEVALHAPSLAWHDGDPTGTFDATWRRARLAVGTVAIDLGTVSVAGLPADDGLAGTIRNAGGDVALDGSLAARARTLGVQLTLTPTSDAPEAVKQVLPFLGTPDGAGGVRIAWRSAP